MEDVASKDDAFFEDDKHGNWQLASWRRSKRLKRVVLIRCSPLCTDAAADDDKLVNGHTT